MNIYSKVDVRIVAEIYNIIMLMIAVWSFSKDFFPDQQIVHIESMLQETIEVGNELIELQIKELEIESQQKEIQSQQLEEEKKQTQLLEVLVEDLNKSE